VTNDLRKMSPADEATDKRAWEISDECKRQGVRGPVMTSVIPIASTLSLPKIRSEAEFERLRESVSNRRA